MAQPTQDTKGDLGTYILPNGITARRYIDRHGNRVTTTIEPYPYSDPTPLSDTKTLDELRENILTEFKQVLKLAPSDYTENCTNVVMSMVSDLISNQVAEATKRGYLNGYTQARADMIKENK